MQILDHAELVKDVKKLKRYPSAQASLDAWKRLFEAKGLNETPGIAAYPGFGGAKIFKARVIPLKEQVGKSDGYRLIFQIRSDGAHVIIVFSRHGIYHDERELAALIKQRVQ